MGKAFPFKTTRFGERLAVNRRGIVGQHGSRIRQCSVEHNFPSYSLAACLFVFANSYDFLAAAAADTLTISEITVNLVNFPSTVCHETGALSSNCSFNGADDSAVVAGTASAIASYGDLGASATASLATVIRTLSSVQHQEVSELCRGTTNFFCRTMSRVCASAASQLGQKRSTNCWVSRPK
jgi:hypothetical protein